VTEIKIRRLEWLGHVIRMEDTCIPKMILNTKPCGRHGVGRPKLRSLDNVEADINSRYKKMDTKSSRQKRLDSSSKGG
jgi:hypothetical protein